MDRNTTWIPLVNYLANLRIWNQRINHSMIMKTNINKALNQWFRRVNKRIPYKNQWAWCNNLRTNNSKVNNNQISILILGYRCHRCIKKIYHVILFSIFFELFSVPLRLKLRPTKINQVPYKRINITKKAYLEYYPKTEYIPNPKVSIHSHRIK